MPRKRKRTTRDHLRLSCYLLKQFNHKIPDKVLVPFLQAIMDQGKPHAGASEPSRIVLWAQVIDTLVFTSPSGAIARARYHLARQTSRTWGEFFNSIEEDWRDHFRLLLAELAEEPDFQGYYEKLLRKNPALPREEAWQAWRELDDPMVLDQDPFDDDLVASFEQDYGAGPGDIRGSVEGFVPQEILEQYAEDASTMFDGPFYEFLPEMAEEIVEAYSKLGYLLIEDELLLDATCWFIEDPAAIYARIRHYEDVQAEIERIEAGRADGAEGEEEWDRGEIERLLEAKLREAAANPPQEGCEEENE